VVCSTAVLTFQRKEAGRQTCCVPPRRMGRAGYWLREVLVVVAAAQRRLGPSSSAMTSTVDRALPSSAVQVRCWSRPTTTTRLPLLSESATCSAWSRHTITVKNDASCSLRPETATRNMARAMPPSVCRNSGSSVRLPAKLTLASAVEGGRLARNAATGVKPPKVQRKEMHFLDAEQVEWLAALAELRYRPLILFAAYTGLRPCELVALRVGRLDLLRCTARVVEAAVEVSRLEWGPVKTHEARVVRMPRSVAEELAASLATRPHSPEALVFTAPLGGPLSRADFVRNCFKPAVLAANEAIAKLPKDRRPAPLPDGLRFHDLRHTCASLLIAQGASIKAVQAQLGHATASITLDTYGHLFPSEMEALADRLEMVRDAALARRARTQRGPADDRLEETAGG
jgi:integrase